MMGYSTNIEKDTLENTDFRRVLFTGPNVQLVLMSLRPGEEIGSEVHHGNEQFIRVESGTAVAKIGERQFDLTDGSIIVVPAAARHNVTNTSSTEDLKLYTLYAPPHHPEGTIQHTKTEADAAEVLVHST